MEIPVKKPKPKVNPRDLFLPKLPELAEQCPSCPFRSGNDLEFGEIIRKLCASGNVKFSPAVVRRARASITDEAKHVGDFSCHHTAYRDDMSLKDVREHRQCPGATRAFKESGQ